MSRWVEWGGKRWGRGLFDVPADLPPGTCPRCGGLGVVPEQLDWDRHDVAVPCIACNKYCPGCHRWVKIAGHKCSKEDP